MPIPAQTQKAEIPSWVPRRIWALKQRVEEHEGILTITMGELRDAYGAERLGRNILQDIQLILKRLKLKHMPSELPSYQDVLVRLYLADSPVANIISAALRVGPGADDILRNAASSRAVTALEKIQKLVEQLQEEVEDCLL